MKHDNAEKSVWQVSGPSMVAPWQPFRALHPIFPCQGTALQSHAFICRDLSLKSFRLSSRYTSRLSLWHVAYRNTVFRDGNASLLSTIYFNTGLSHLENNNMGIESDSFEKKNYSIQNQWSIHLRVFRLKIKLVTLTYTYKQRHLSPKFPHFAPVARVVGVRWCMLICRLNGMSDTYIESITITAFPLIHASSRILL